MKTTARRLYLSLAVKLLFASGLLALAAVFIASVDNSDSTTESTADRWRLEFSWAGMRPGEYRTLAWPNGRLIGVYRRREQEMARLVQQMADNQGESAAMPRAGVLSPVWRSRHPEIFVFFPYESRRGCRVSPGNDVGTFAEPCFGARFDSTGRRLTGTGEGQQDLGIPDYVLLGQQRLRLQPPGGGHE